MYMVWQIVVGSKLELEAPRALQILGACVYMITSARALPARGPLLKVAGLEKRRLSVVLASGYVSVPLCVQTMLF